MIKYWTTKEGVRLLIKDMKRSHIVNCIAMIERKINEFSIYMEGDEEHILVPSLYFEKETFERRCMAYIEAFRKELTLTN